jgi:hypothetical protein
MRSTKEESHKPPNSRGLRGLLEWPIYPPAAVGELCPFALPIANLNRFLLTFAFIFAGGVAEAKDQTAEPPEPRSPFQSVTVRGDVILAKIASDLRRQMWIGGERIRRAEKGGVILLQSGQTSFMGPDKAGWTYRFTADLGPRPGLSVTATYDTSGAKGMRREQSFFIPAK